MNDEITKRCAICGEFKTLPEFNKQKAGRYGVGSYCKPCNRERCKLNRDRYESQTPRNRRDGWLKRTYDITIEEYTEILRTQDGHCAACISDEKLVVDHDHKTGEVRGILCHTCNIALGMLGEDTERMQGLIQYLLSR